MKSCKRVILAAVLIPVVFCIGCAGTPVKIGATDQQFDRSKIDFTKPRLISAEARGFQLLLWIPISINGRQETAYDRLMAQAGTDYVTDFKIQDSWTYAFIGTIYTTRIEATAYPRRD